MIHTRTYRLARLLLAVSLMLAGLAACSPPETGTAEVARPAGWSDATHGNDAEPNYAVVFPQDKVNQITITITPENWAAMQANMTELFGEPGQGPGNSPGPDKAPSAEGTPSPFQG
jgi:hypothetical protein